MGRRDPGVRLGCGLPHGRGPHPTRLGPLAAVRRQVLTDDQLEAGKQPELAYYLCAGPPGTRDEDLIWVAGARWAIQECFQTAKNEVRLDQRQVGADKTPGTATSPWPCSPTPT